MIPITRLALGQEEAEAAADVVRSGWLMNGPRTEQFERLVADWVGTDHAVAVSSCTTGLHLALLAAGIRPGDEVICPSFSFIATANAIRYVGARPVFIDIDPRTYNLDPDLIELAITRRTRAIMPVSQIGLPADLESVMDIADQHGLVVVEDAAPSLGAEIGGKRVGSISDLTCFSFDARKILTTGEGGMITTNDAAAAARLRTLRAHGASVSTADRDRASKVVLESYAEVGFNYKITDIQAAIGIVQMGKLEAVVAERRRLAQRYEELLAGDERIDTPYEPVGFQHVYQSYCVRLNSDRPQEDIMSAMMDEGVATRRIFSIHDQPAYASDVALELPHTAAAATNCILLPMFVGLTAAEQDRVAETLLSAL
jgi:perosamine synthetase